MPRSLLTCSDIARPPATRTVAEGLPSMARAVGSFSAGDAVKPSREPNGKIRSDRSNGIAALLTLNESLIDSTCSLFVSTRENIELGMHDEGMPNQEVKSDHRQIWQSADRLLVKFCGQYVATCSRTKMSLSD